MNPSHCRRGDWEGRWEGENSAELILLDFISRELTELDAVTCVWALLVPKDCLSRTVLPRSLPFYLDQLKISLEIGGATCVGLHSFRQWFNLDQPSSRVAEHASSSPAQ